MQHIATIEAAAELSHALSFPAGMKAPQKRAFALTAYSDASEAPDFADWRTVADMLASVLPKSRAGESPVVETAAASIPWTLYAIPSYRKLVDRSPVLVVTFTDGRSVRAQAPTLKGKPVNWGRAVHFAITVYRQKIAAFIGLHGRLPEVFYP